MMYRSLISVVRVSSERPPGKVRSLYTPIYRVVEYIYVLHASRRLAHSSQKKKRMGDNEDGGNYFEDGNISHVCTAWAPAVGFMGISAAVVFASA